MRRSRNKYGTLQPQPLACCYGFIYLFVLLHFYGVLYLLRFVFMLSWYALYIYIQNLHVSKKCISVSVGLFRTVFQYVLSVLLINSKNVLSFVRSTCGGPTNTASCACLQPHRPSFPMCPSHCHLSLAISRAISETLVKMTRRPVEGR